MTDLEFKVENPWVNYEIDWDKVESLEDVISILKALSITFSMDEKSRDERTQRIKDIMHLLK